MEQVIIVAENVGGPNEFDLCVGSELEKIAHGYGCTTKITHVMEAFGLSSIAVSDNPQYLSSLNFIFFTSSLLRLSYPVHLFSMKTIKLLLLTLFLSTGSNILFGDDDETKIFNSMPSWPTVKPKKLVRS